MTASPQPPAASDLPGPQDARPLNVVYLCTGNAARSAMAAIITRSWTDAVDITGAGTHAIPGLPMSHRTRNALAGLGFADPSHRSTQLEWFHVERADLIVAFAPEHVAYVRRTHPEGSARTATLKRLVEHLDHTDGTANHLSDRLAALELDTVEVEPWEEVLDPAGGDEDVFHDCVREVHDLLAAFLPRIGVEVPGSGPGASA